MKLALTGGVAEGKSTVASYIREAGFDVLSVDDLARETFQEPEVQAALASLLGRDAPVDAATVRGAIFSDHRLRREVNGIMHPRIVHRLKAAQAPVAEVPLLFETCLHPLFERVWVVTCGAQRQMERLVQRLGDPEAARAMITAQLPTRVKCAFADRIVRTNAAPETVRSYVFKTIGRDMRSGLA